MKRACVIGWPVEHSLSPVIHGYWLRHYGIEGEYVRMPVSPEELRGFLRDLGDRGFIGANITIPHKVEAVALCDRLEPAAQAIGAVNTVWLEEGRLAGANTDATGLMAHLDATAPGWDGRAKIAAVIGAGGAARAIVWALGQRGFNAIRIVNRSIARANETAQLAPQSSVFSFDAIGEALQDATFIVNTSSLGMTGQPPLKIDLSPLQAGAVVCDIVYSPLETELLRDAEARGFAAVDGLGMLLHQAAPGFEKWFGVRPEVTHDLRETVLKAISSRR